jgi:peptidoglycan/xylan/chitin deacetylase (PgdA/CDA1 family)
MRKATPATKLVLSVDLDEWFHSRRWVDGQQALQRPDTAAFLTKFYGSEEPTGELVAPTRQVLRLLRDQKTTITFFILGQVARWYPDLVREIHDHGHEIGSHGMYHVDMTVLGPAVFAEQLEESARILEGLTGIPPVGFRAPNLVYEPWATSVLERLGFVYDASVCASRPLGGKYRGWIDAPMAPYHPRYDDVATPGDATLVELPLPSFPVLKIAAGSGIVMRVFGFHWTYWAIRSALRHGNSSFYFHPWELGPRPSPAGHRLKNEIFLRHTGPWMARSVERIVKTFATRIVTARTSADELLASDPRAAAAASGASALGGSPRPAIE